MVSVSRPGAVLLILFVGSAVLLGDLMGSFADPDRRFVSLFADSGNRMVYIIGGALLLLAGMAFIWFAHALSLETGSRRVPLLTTGAAAAGSMMLAGLAFAAVPLSLTFGSFFDDPGLESGQAVLPQFGYVAFSVGGMLPAALFMLIAARAPGLLPRWLRLATYPAALLVALTAVLFMPMAIFVAWVIAATASNWHRSSPELE